MELNSDKGWAVKRKKLELKAHKMCPHKRNSVFRGLRLNNTASDQPAHPHSLISAFVICFFENIMCKLANGKISILLIVSVLLDFSLTVKATTLIFISGCGSANSSAKEGKSDFTYNLVKSK